MYLSSKLRNKSKIHSLNPNVFVLNELQFHQLNSKYITCKFSISHEVIDWNLAIPPTYVSHTPTQQFRFGWRSNYFSNFKKTTSHWRFSKFPFRFFINSVNIAHDLKMGMADTVQDRCIPHLWPDFFSNCHGNVESGSTNRLLIVFSVDCQLHCCHRRGALRK